MLFEPFRINHTEFGNRVLRSSMGGRYAFYDGTVSPAWTHFEKRFAEKGVAGIISATISVNETRMSPLEYPALHNDRFVKPLRDAIREIKRAGTARSGCKYIIQLGDTGAATHTSLLPEDGDRLSASWFFDFLYGYHNSALAMSPEQIKTTISDFQNAARRARDAECDGVEVTASKGYLIHQFLNPATNRRKDAYGGSVENRFRLLGDIVKAVRKEVGKDFLFGIRLSAKDFNFLPINLRFPPVWPPRHYLIGNDLRETKCYAQKLQKLEVDYLHIDRGYGFPNPKGNPGFYPDEGAHLFFNATRHLSRKAAIRASLFNVLPSGLRKALFGFGWHRRLPTNCDLSAASADFAGAIRSAVEIPVIANGGFQDYDTIEKALTAGKCHMVAIARPLLANPGLLDLFARGLKPEKPCSFCSLCCSQAAVLPLGCYDRRRFPSDKEMVDQILRWSSPNGPNGGMECNVGASDGQNAISVGD